MKNVKYFYLAYSIVSIIIAYLHLSIINRCTLIAYGDSWGEFSRQFSVGGISSLNVQISIGALIIFLGLTIYSLFKNKVKLVDELLIGMISFVISYWSYDIVFTIISHAITCAKL